MEHLDHIQHKPWITISSLINRQTHSETHSIPSSNRPNNLKMDVDNNFSGKLFQLAGALLGVRCAPQDLDQLSNQLPPLFKTIKTHKISKTKKLKLPTLLLWKLLSTQKEIFYRRSEISLEVSFIKNDTLSCNFINISNILAYRNLIFNIK